MPKERKGENFYSVYLFQDPENVLIGLNYKELQKSSTHYKHSLYNQRSQRSPTQYNLLRIAESKCSTPYITYTESQKSSAGYNLFGITGRRNQKCSFRKDAFRNFTKLTGKQLCQSLFFSKVAGLKPFFTKQFLATASYQQKCSSPISSTRRTAKISPYNLPGIAEIPYSV